jgi:O-antigen/teichoic acid export membrane protein
MIRYDLGAAAPFAGLLLAGVVITIIDAPRLIARAKGGAPSLHRATTYASYGAPLALALAIELGVQTLARFILADQAGAATLGAYAAAFGLARPLDLVFIGAGAAFAPLILTAYESEGAEAARRLAGKGFAVIAALAAPAALGLALISVPLANLMIGDGLRADAAAAMPWLALAGVFAGFNLYYWSEAFQLTRRTGLRALIMLAPGAVQIALTVALAASLGAVGAAIAAAAGAVTGSVPLAGFGRRLFALPLPLGALARTGAAAALMVLAVLALPTFTGAAALFAPLAVGACADAIGAVALNVLGARTWAAAALRKLFAAREAAHVL